MKAQSFAALVWQLLKESEEPFSADEVLWRVSQVRPIDTRSPLQTIRHALVQCRLIASTGDGRYGWYPRMMQGSRVRVPLIDSDLEASRIVIDDEVRELLWPSFFAIQTLSDRAPVQATLQNGTETTLALEFFGKGVWGLGGSPQLWHWLDTAGAAVGDHLIIEAQDAMARNYLVGLERQSGRDDKAIQLRTEAVEEAALDLLWNRRTRGCPVWDLSKYLLSRAYYRNPVPPEPLSQIFSRALRAVEMLNAAGERKWKAWKPGSRTYQLKVVLQDTHPPVWRRVRVPGAVTLEDLHWILQITLGWTNSHLHQFEIGGTCYSDPDFDLDELSDTKTKDESRTTLEKAVKNEGSQFSYQYDFGDDWQHSIEVEKILPAGGAASPVLCMDGQRACPPEDCGGAHGYEDFLTAIGNPSDPQHAELLEWCGAAFDPDRCDRTAINWQLRKLSEFAASPRNG